jgi:hypothetical protein
MPSAGMAASLDFVSRPMAASSNEIANQVKEAAHKHTVCAVEYVNG